MANAVFGFGTDWFLQVLTRSSINVKAKHLQCSAHFILSEDFDFRKSDTIL